VLSTKNFTGTAPLPDPVPTFAQSRSNGYIRMRMQGTTPPVPKFRRMDRLPDPPPSGLVKKGDPEWRVRQPTKDELMSGGRRVLSTTG
jgi:hypothetical protein